MTMTTTTTTMHVGRLVLPARRLAVSLGTVVLGVAGAPALAQPVPATTTPAALHAGMQAAADTATQTLADQFDNAMQACEANHWPQAFAAWCQLAELGHRDATRLMLQMHHHGMRLYGQALALTPLQMERFSQQRHLPQCAVRFGPCRRRQSPRSFLLPTPA